MNSDHNILFQKYNSKGFTLIELLVVISIVGLLSSIVLASLSSAKDKSRIAAGQIFSGHTYQAFGADAVGVWNFNDSTNIGKDESGNNNNGTIVGGGATQSSDTPSGQGKSLLFNGSSYIDVGMGTNSLDSIGNTFTIAGWIKTAYPNARMTIYSSGNYDKNPIFGTSANTPGGLEIFYPGVFVAFTQGGILKTNTWHYVAYSRNGTGNNHHFYIDGVAYPVTGGAVTDNFTSTAYEKYIGLRDPLNTAYFTGNIDDLRVYTQALTAYQIQQIYAEGITKYLASN